MGLMMIKPMTRKKVSVEPVEKIWLSTKEFAKYIQDAKSIKSIQTISLISELSSYYGEYYSHSEKNGRLYSSFHSIYLYVYFIRV